MRSTLGTLERDARSPDANPSSAHAARAEVSEREVRVAYLLKESFGQLWDYEREGWARRFFENWRASLKWQRLKPYEKFARMIDSHWDGIARVFLQRRRRRGLRLRLKHDGPQPGVGRVSRGCW